MNINIIAIFPLSQDHIAAAKKLLREWEIDIQHAEAKGAPVVGRFTWFGGRPTSDSALAGAFGENANNAVFFTPEIRQKHSRFAGRDIADHEIKFIVQQLGRCAAGLYATGDQSFIDRVRKECARQKIDFEV